MRTGNLGQLVKSCLSPIIDFVYPPRCLGCSQPVHPEDILCPNCLADLMRLPADRDSLLQNPYELTFPISATMLYAAFELEPEAVLSTCIHAMKYRGMKHIGFWLGRLLGEALVDSCMIQDNPLLLPVPLHRVKQLERGYNQAEWIAEGISIETGLRKEADILYRRFSTQSQAAGKLQYQERNENVSNAFSIHAHGESVLRGRVVILVDDIITTGATMSACSLLLLECGVKEIRLAAVARPVKGI